MFDKVVMRNETYRSGRRSVAGAKGRQSVVGEEEIEASPKAKRRRRKKSVADVKKSSKRHRCREIEA
nr:hypothetical protein CFP56_65304 [Quercus suber]